MKSGAAQAAPAVLFPTAMQWLQTVPILAMGSHLQHQAHMQDFEKGGLHGDHTWKPYPLLMTTPISVSITFYEKQNN